MRLSSLRRSGIVLPCRSVVIVPEEARGATTPWPPWLGNPDEGCAVGALLQALQPLHGDLQRQIAGGPDVEPLQSEQQVDLRRPAADSLQLHEFEYRLLVR